MSFFRTLLGSLLFLFLAIAVFWLVYFNAQPVLPLQLTGFATLDQALPNPLPPFLAPL